MDEIIKWRRHLHQIPEMGMEEYETTMFLENELAKMGYEPKKLLETGVYVFVDNKKEDTYAFRSDIDAILVDETNEVSYKSQKQGVMHACGHDGHMAAMLGFAKRISQKLDECNHNILFIFQPAEENKHGAKQVVETGIFEKYNVKAIFGMHLMPSIENGKIASKSGALMASSSELDILVKGKSAHAGLYHQGVDSIVVTSQLISQYQTIISRIKEPFDTSVISIGKIYGR